MLFRLIVALVLAGTATAARPVTPTTGFTGQPVFVSTPSADGIHRDVSLTFTFTHRGTVGLRIQITYNGVVGPLDTWGTYRGIGSETFTLTIPGTDCLAPVPGDKVSYYVQLIRTRGHQTVVLDEITTETYTVT